MHICLCVEWYVVGWGWGAVCANRGNPQVIAVKHVLLVAMIICLQEYSLCCFIEFHIDSLHFWFYIW